MDMSVYSTDGVETEVDDEVKENGDELSNMYRPKSQTYTLADFIQEKSEPVIVRARPESVKAEETFEEVRKFKIVN